ncbi:hypothetical protein ACF09J_25710 [Streptomyces sp. NPDC014889]|uniref:hypothetical protein n=1 Tax=Streptomyces sp. NPDC014889 TaxID=3364928 RepID=UPI0036F9A505
MYFAHKANRSSALVRRLAAEDVASVGVHVAPDAAPCSDTTAHVGRRRARERELADLFDERERRRPAQGGSGGGGHLTVGPHGWEQLAGGAGRAVPPGRGSAFRMVTVRPFTRVTGRR